MSNSQNKRVFLSYCWSDKDLADTIDNHFRRIGVRIERDVRDLVNLADMREYMRRTRMADYTIAIISPKYMSSLNCMYEIKELIKSLDYTERLIPIVREDFSISKLETQKVYYDYWHQRDINLRQDVLKYPIESVSDTIKIIEEIKVYIFDFFKAVMSKKYIAEQDLLTSNAIDDIFRFLGLEDTEFLTRLQKLYDINDPELRELKMLALANEYNVDENNVPFLFAKAYIADSDGKYNLAISRYNQVLAIDNTFSEAYFNLAILYATIYNNLDQAVQNYRLAIKYDPDNVSALNNLANILVEIGEYDEAKLLLEDALLISPNTHITFHNFGIYYQRIGDKSNAVNMYRKALDLEPTSPYTIDNYANLIIDEYNDIDQARELYKAALAEQPNESDFYYNYAIMITDHFPNEQKEAEHYFLKAIELNPNDYEIHNSFAMRYWLPLEKYSKVEEHLKAALALNNSSSHVLYNLGIFYETFFPDKHLSKEYYNRAVDSEDASEVIYAAAIESQYKSDCVYEAKLIYLRGRLKFDYDRFLSAIRGVDISLIIDELDIFSTSTKRYVAVNQLLLESMKLVDWDIWAPAAYKMRWDEPIYTSIKNDLLNQLSGLVPNLIPKLDDLIHDIYQVTAKIVDYKSVDTECAYPNADELFNTTVGLVKYHSLFRHLATLLNEYKHVINRTIDDKFCESINDFLTSLTQTESEPAKHI